MTGGVLSPDLTTARPRALASALVLGAVCGLLLVLGGPAGTAQAHTELDNAIPAAGARLATTPGNVQLTFTEPIDAEVADIVVRGPDGQDLTVGPARQSGEGLMQPISPSAQPGRVTVAYRVISLDGHPVSDTFSFRVLRGDPSAAGGDGSASGSGGGEDSTGAVGGLDGSGSSTGLVVGVAAVVVLLAAGGVLAHRRRHRLVTPNAHPSPPAP
jgi:copper resistance protein C